MLCQCPLNGKVNQLYMCVCVCVCVLVAQLCPTLCDPMGCGPPGSSVHEILQARMLEWVASSCSNVFVYVCAHVCAYTLFLEPPSHFPPSHPSRSSQSAKLSSLCYPAASHQLPILHVVVDIHQSYSPNLSQPPLPPHIPISTCPFSTSQIAEILTSLCLQLLIYKWF